MEMASRYLQGTEIGSKGETSGGVGFRDIGETVFPIVGFAGGRSGISASLSVLETQWMRWPRVGWIHKGLLISGTNNLASDGLE